MTSCGKCGKVGASEDSIVSCIVCDDTFCIPCSKLLSTEVRVVQLKSPSTLIFCCQPCKAEIKKPLAVQIKFMREQIKLMTDTIRDKQVIIEDKTRIIAYLEANTCPQISSMELDRVDREKNNSNSHRHNIPYDTVSKTYTAAVEANGACHDPDQVNRKGLIESKQQTVMDAIINLERDNSSHRIQRSHRPFVQSAGTSGEAWKTVNYKARRNKHKTVLGANTSELSIVAVESRRNIFVSRLSPDTTPEQLQRHLEENKVKPLSVQKLDIKSKDIAAFKVVVQQSDEKHASNSELWPKYTIIRPFRQPKVFLPRSSQSNQST